MFASKGYVMEPYDWSHHDRLRADELWRDDQRRWEDLRRRTDDMPEAGPWLGHLVKAGLMFVGAWLIFALFFSSH